MATSSASAAARLQADQRLHPTARSLQSAVAQLRALASAAQSHSAPANYGARTACSRSRGRGISMKNVANTRFAIKSWDEKPFGEGQDLPKLTRATVTRAFTGDIAGEGRVEYLMMYRSDGSATFVGLERVVGHLREDGELRAPTRWNVREWRGEGVLFVIPGSGTESSGACAARARRLSATGLSILYR